MATMVFNGTTCWALQGGRSSEVSLQLAYISAHSCLRTLNFFLLEASAFRLTGPKSGA